MRPHPVLLLLLLALLARDALTADRVLQLREGTPADRIDAARSLYGSGRVDGPAQAEMARRLALGLDAGSDSREAIEEMRWYVRTLGATGDPSLRPLLERARRSHIRTIARESAEALELLARTSFTGMPFLLPERVRLIDQAEADHCRFLRTHICRNGDDAAGCLAEHRELAARAGGSAVLVLTQVDDAITGQFDTASMVAKHYRCTVPAG